MNLRIIDRIIKNALDEDVSWGDVTTETLIDASFESELSIVLKEEGVIAGLSIAERTFRLLEPDLIWTPFVKDGDYLPKGTQLVTLSGKAQNLLIAERVALNFLQRLSGIATITHKFVKAAKETSQTVRILDTRKTTPGLRYFEKYAVRMGGGHNHRYNLSDAVLVKDNHLAILKKDGKSIKDTIKKLKDNIPHTVKIEIEVDTIVQLKEVLKEGVDTLLLDNMSCNELKEAVYIVDGKAKTEASGNVSLETVAEIAATGVDYISAGALTHSAPSLDISLDY